MDSRPCFMDWLVYWSRRTERILDWFSCISFQFSFLWGISWFPLAIACYLIHFPIPPCLIANNTSIKSCWWLNLLGFDSWARIKDVQAIVVDSSTLPVVHVFRGGFVVYIRNPQRCNRLGLEKLTNLLGFTIESYLGFIVQRKVISQEEVVSLFYHALCISESGWLSVFFPCILPMWTRFGSWTRALHVDWVFSPYTDSPSRVIWDLSSKGN